MPTPATIGWILLALLVAVPRILGFKGEAYQAGAHFLMGSLWLALWWGPNPRRWFFLGLFTALCVVEVVCALFGTL